MWSKTIDLPGLAMSRSLGDFFAKSLGVLAEPEISVLSINKLDNNSSAQPIAVVLASDGIWDMLSSINVIEIITGKLKLKQQAKDCTEQLVSQATKLWRNEPYNRGAENSSSKNVDIDDITCIVAYLGS